MTTPYRDGEEPRPPPRDRRTRETVALTATWLACVLAMGWSCDRLGASSSPASVVFLVGVAWTVLAIATLLRIWRGGRTR